MRVGRSILIDPPPQGSFCSLYPPMSCPQASHEIKFKPRIVIKENTHRRETRIGYHPLVFRGVKLKSLSQAAFNVSKNISTMNAHSSGACLSSPLSIILSFHSNMQGGDHLSRIPFSGVLRSSPQTGVPRSSPQRDRETITRFSSKPPKTKGIRYDVSDTHSFPFGKFCCFWRLAVHIREYI